MNDLTALATQARELLGDGVLSQQLTLAELTFEVDATQIQSIATQLRDHEMCHFDQLIDLCAVDYSTYGAPDGEPWTGSRYAVVYHLLSLYNNQRIRLRAQLDDTNPTIDSVLDIWPAANWFEREAFDLFGIIFVGHPDLRRLLTDYGFIGHPFRKDFPLSGHVEMHYDAEQERVVYRPVTVEERILVPRVIRPEIVHGDASDATREEAMQPPPNP